MPKTVQANMKFGQWHDIEVEDDVTAYVEYENGATGVFVTSTGDACGSNRLEIQLDKARIVAENDKLTVTEFSMSEPEFSATNTIPFAHPEYIPVEVETDGKNEQHVGVINAWGGAILRGEPLVAHGSEGIQGLMLSNAMHLSAWMGKPVELPVDEDLFYEELMKRVRTSRLKTNVHEVVADLSNTYSGTK
jgi:predicted dehydrogenase